MSSTFEQERRGNSISIEVIEEPSNDEIFRQLADRFKDFLSSLERGKTIDVNDVEACDRLLRFMRTRLRRKLRVSGPDARETIDLARRAAEVIASKPPQSDPERVEEARVSLFTRANLLEEKITTGQVEV